MINALAEIAQAAGATLMDMRNSARERFAKGKGDFATDADLAAQELILNRLAKEFTGIEIIAEEQTAHEIPGKTFFTVDPLDGTFNYAKGTDTWGVLLSFIENGVPTLGISYLPAKQILVTAAAGHGCKVNGAPAKLQKADSLADAIINLDIGAWMNKPLATDYVLPLIGETLVFRSLGSAAANFAELAAGATSASVYLIGTKIWDLAAGHVIATESGGRSCGIDGAPLDWNQIAMNGMFCASSGIEQELLARFPKSR